MSILSDSQTVSIAGVVIRVKAQQIRYVRRLDKASRLEQKQSFPLVFHFFPSVHKSGILDSDAIQNGLEEPSCQHCVLDPYNRDLVLPSI